MISMHDAFTGDTTIPVRYFKSLSGYYDEDNHWVDEGFEDPVIIHATPIPYGDRQAGISGTELKAKTTGERQPAFMKFTTTFELELNDRVESYGLTYKIMKKGDYTGAGFYKCIGTTILEDTNG